MPERVSTSEPVKVGFVSLGCPKNLVDSEVMMGLVARAGAEITPRPEEADVIVVNTCSFIDSAQQESVNTILEMANRIGEDLKKLSMLEDAPATAYAGERMMVDLGAAQGP